MTSMMDRRQFLVRTAYGALCVSTLSAVAGTNTGRITKAIKFQNIAEPLSVLDKFKLLKDLGFDGVEIRTRDKVDPKQLLEARERTGLPIHGVIHSDAPDLEAAIDLSAHLGGDSVLIVAGRVNEKNSYDQVYREQQARIRPALPHAEKKKVKLLVENVWNNFLLSPLEMARFLDELESPWVGAYFDVGNVVRFGYPEQWIRILGKRIGKLDIKEYSRKKQLEEGLRKGFQVEIGEGDVDWAAVRTALAEIDYRGWATAEVGNGDRHRLADIGRRMDKVLDL